MSDLHRRVRPKAWRGLALVASAVFALTSCGGDSSAASDATVLEVELGRFVIQPAVLDAPAGNLKLRVTNVDPDLVHDLVVYGKGTRRLSPGDSQTIEIPDAVAGQYRMWCDVPGHANAGQVGTLVVNTAPAATIAST